MDLGAIRVLDLTRLLPGPYGTQLLADLGMDVIKVEDTDLGDYARDIDVHPDAGVGTIYESVNRGKRSVAIDLKDERGRRAFYDLVETADVVFEGFRPGVVERLGVDYETLRAYNDDLIYCSLSGFGQAGPLANRVGHDLNYAGLAGFLDMNRADEDSPPTPPGFPIVDTGSGLFAAFCILGGLLDRAFGGGGEYLDVSMSDVMLSFSQYYAGDVLRGESPRPGDTRLGGAYPCYGVYRTADDRYVTVAALEPQFWEALCTAIDREDLVAHHLSEDPAVRVAVREDLQDVFASAPREAWEDRLDDVDAAVLGVYTLEEALEHPQFRERGMVEEFAERAPRLGFPATMSGDLDLAADVPDQGEHTAAILGDLGYGDEEIRTLADAGAVLTG